MRVLIVEDEVRMASLIRRGLVNEGLAADVTGNGEDALWMAAAVDYVGDGVLGHSDHLSACREDERPWIRRTGCPASGYRV